MGEKKFKIFLNEESWERVIGRGLDTMFVYHVAQFINSGQVEGR